MHNGCETGACSLARIFYQTQCRLLWRLKHRAELTAFYHATYDSWAPDLSPRSFAQVLYALVNDGRILRINKGRFLVWTDPDCPHNTTHTKKKKTQTQTNTQTQAQTQAKTQTQTQAQTQTQTQAQTQTQTQTNPTNNTHTST
jgi:hypothetical protein